MDIIVTFPHYQWIIRMLAPSICLHELYPFDPTITQLLPNTDPRNLGPSFPCLMINHGFIERPKLFWLLIQFTRLHLRFVHHSLVPDAIASKSLSSVAESWCMCCLLIMKQEPIQIRHEVSNQSMDLYNSSNLNGV
eukprot:191653_1